MHAQRLGGEAVMIVARLRRYKQTYDEEKKREI